MCVGGWLWCKKKTRACHQPGALSKFILIPTRLHDSGKYKYLQKDAKLCGSVQHVRRSF